MITVTINAKTFLAAMLFRGIKDSRERFNGAIIETGPEGAFFVATDGCTLCTVRVSKDALPASRIVVPGSVLTAFKVGERGEVDFTFASTCIADDAGDRLPRKIIMEYRTLSASGQEIFVEPPTDWRRVIPVAPSGEPAQYSPEYTMRVLKAARLVHHNPKTAHYPGIVMNGSLPGLAVINSDMVAVVAPMVMREETPECPTWALAGFPQPDTTTPQTQKEI